VTRANYDKTGLNAPTPVGLFPRGRTPEGIDDLAGNVWEWMLEDYDGAKALRGGSWSINARIVRVSYRVRNRPGDRYDYIGFRCVGE
jgi:formylglycine-generating enzyme required for sulfatase activity